MSFTYGFYNSVNHDRVYDARQLSQIFDGLIVDGVYKAYGDKFAVTPSSGMTVNVGTGRAWFNHTWMYNDSLLPITLGASDMTLTRIDAIVLEVNSGIRTNTIKVVQGELSSNPVRPTLTNTDSLHQYAICYITVPGGASAIVASNIEMVTGTTATPYVKGIVDFNNDYVQQFSDAISALESGKANDETWVSYTIPVTGWNNKVYSFESDYPSSTYDIIEIAPNVTTTATARKQWDEAAVNGYRDTNTIYCNGKQPKMDISVSLCIRRRN